MVNTVWKGQLTFGLVSFPVRLVRAARKDRIPLRYVRQTLDPEAAEDDDSSSSVFPNERETARPFRAGDDHPLPEDRPTGTAVEPVRQAYTAANETEPLSASELHRGYEVAPGQFAVVRSEELRRLRQPTSSEMAILRSVRMDEIDPVFLETSYYVLPGNGGEHSYGLFYRALSESGYAALAEVAMHGRQHVVVIRPGAKGLLAHTMFYINEVRGNEEHAAETNGIMAKELDLAKRFVEAIAAPFQPEEFTDRYREQLESLIASKAPVPTREADQTARPAAGKVVDIMDALRKSLEAVKKPAAKAESTVGTAAQSKRRIRR